jgi:hypothetical protein
LRFCCLKMPFLQNRILREEEWKFWKFSFFKVSFKSEKFENFHFWNSASSVKILKIFIFQIVVLDLRHHLIFINKINISNSNDTRNYHFLRFGFLRNLFLHIENFFKKRENFYFSKSCLVWFLMWAIICSSKIK